MDIFLLALCTGSTESTQGFALFRKVKRLLNHCGMARPEVTVMVVVVVLVVCKSGCAE